MKILVLVHEGPDRWGDRKMLLHARLVDRAARQTALCEIGQRSLKVPLPFTRAIWPGQAARIAPPPELIARRFGEVSGR